jgi:hypothetical protein
MPQDCDGFWFACKANSPVHIEIWAGGFNAAGERKNQ